MYIIATLVEGGRAGFEPDPGRYGIFIVNALPSKMAPMLKRASDDRRSGRDRRQERDFDYFRQGGAERRSYSERRVMSERRTGWARINPWSSAAKRY